MLLQDLHEGRIASSLMASSGSRQRQSSRGRDMLHAIFLAAFFVILALFATAVAHQPSLHSAVPPT